MSTLGRRFRAALRRAGAFYRGRIRILIWLAAALALTSLVLSGVPQAVVLLAAAGLAAAILVFAGSRAFGAQQDATAARARPVAQTSRPAATWPASASAGRAGPLVSVVVTAHNDVRFVVDCLTSVCRQTWASWECIVVDDASTDRTLEVAMDAFDDDRRFRFSVLASRSGVSAARNVGLDAARGEYVTFLDGDDFLFAWSLERRAEALLAAVERPGVVGVYCDWVGVPESCELAPEGRPAMARDRITWLVAADGAPLINSAPLLVTDEVRRLGGYRESWAEDADLWNRLLRHGYVLEPVLDNGVAYRQKAASRFRTSAGQHASAMRRMADENRLPLRDTVHGTPPPYREGVDRYQAPIARIRRALIGLTTAAGERDDEAVESLMQELQKEWLDVVWTAIDVPAVVHDAAMRHEAYQDEGRQERAEAVMSAVMGALADRIPPFRWTVPAAPNGPIADPPRVRVARARSRDELIGAALESAVSDAVVLMPAVAYHVDEMGPLAEALADRDRKVVMAVSDRRWPDVASALRSFEVPIVRCPDPGPWVSSGAAFVTLNDWGEVYRDIVLAAQEAGLPTFAKVEGVQDFFDADVHWDRNAYRTVDHVLAQGSNDALALEGCSVHIVGSSRLEAIWRGPATSPRRPLAVLNANFTYEVFGEVRDGWLATAGAACDEFGLPYVVSLHPSERPYHGPAAASDPMRHLLTHATVLVSRFSTVPFEAMARGVPFVYFNPHGEKVPVFHEPGGAFDVAHDDHELRSILADPGRPGEAYRDRSREFFLSQVSIVDGHDPAMRAADVIEEIAYP